MLVSDNRAVETASDCRNPSVVVPKLGYIKYNRTQLKIKRYNSEISE